MRILKLFIAVFILIGIGLGLTAMAEHFNLLPIKVEDKSALISVIWQVHGGVATLSIALLALITGLNKEKKYGLKKLDFLINLNTRKWKFLKLHEEIMLSILILFLQYFFVAFDALAGTVFLFTIGILLILVIFHTVIKLFLFEDEFDREIKQYFFHRLETSLEEENKKILELERKKHG